MTRSVDMCCDNECQIDGPTRSERSSSARQSEARALSRGPSHSHREILRALLCGSKLSTVVCSTDCRFSCCLLVVVKMMEEEPGYHCNRNMLQIPFSSRQSKIRTSPPRILTWPYIVFILLLLMYTRAPGWHLRNLKRGAGSRASRDPLRCRLHSWHTSAGRTTVVPQRRRPASGSWRSRRHRRLAADLACWRVLERTTCASPRSRGSREARQQPRRSAPCRSSRRQR